jgi:hypothetical protein
MISNIENIMSEPKRNGLDKKPSDALLPLAGAPKEPLTASDNNAASKAKIATLS